MTTASEMRILGLFGSVVIFGSERGNLEVLSALRERGAKVLLLMSDADYAADARAYVEERGFEIATSPYFVPPREDHQINPWVDLPLRVARGSLRFLQVHGSFRPTHIHVGNQPSVLNFLPALALNRTPLVYRCGDAPILHNGVWRFTWRFIAKRATRFAAVSRYISDLMVAAGAPREKIDVVYSRPPTRASKKAARAQVARMIVGYMGQITEKKGVGVLVDAFAKVADDYPEARLLIAGRVSDWVGDRWAWELRERTRLDPRLADKVEFVGYMEDIPSFLARCSVHVAPTLTEEPMGNTVMEAKQAGLPSIIFRSGGFPEVIEHEVNGFICEEKSADALEAGLRYYLSDLDRTGRQGRAARGSLETLGTTDFSARWATIYAEAAGDR